MSNSYDNLIPTTNPIACAMCHGLGYTVAGTPCKCGALRERFMNSTSGQRDYSVREELNKEITTLRQQLSDAELHTKQVERGLDKALAKLYEAEKYKADADHKQSIIDRLMLEYCPKEMTPEQLKTWAENQVPVPAEEQAAIYSAIAGKEK